MRTLVVLSLVVVAVALPLAAQTGHCPGCYVYLDPDRPGARIHKLWIRWSESEGTYKFYCDGKEGQVESPTVFAWRGDTFEFQLSPDAKHKTVEVQLDGKPDWGAGKEPKVFDGNVRKFSVGKERPATYVVAADAGVEDAVIACDARKQTDFFMTNYPREQPGPGVIVCPPQPIPCP